VTLEKVVRPYLPPSVFTGVAVPPASPKQPTEAKLSLTGPTGTDFVETDVSVTVTDWKVEKNKEDGTKRQTTTKRIENPDDSSQYVMVERMQKATFEDEDTKKKQEFEFAQWEDEQKQAILGG